MPKFIVEVDLDIDTWLRANRSIKKINTHTRKYIDRTFRPRREWIILSNMNEPGCMGLRTRGDAPLFVRYVSTRKLTVGDIGNLVGYIGDNDQKYAFGLGESNTKWGVQPYAYGFSSTTRGNTYKKLKERLGAYLDYVNDETPV